jgi:hypothetical protein
MSLADDENEPYNRWQGFRITQLSLCISLFLTFSVATLGFSINLLVQKFEFTNCLAKASFLLSVICGLLSVSCGSVACLTRLWDFRKTAAVVRHRADQTKKADVERWREEYRRLGRTTWCLFYWQLGLFGAQVIGLIVSLGITCWNRLT